ncbi:unnamed protein product, partial [Didymodactylos carnosus]
EALEILCNSLQNKIDFYGDFSEEVIQTQSRIGALYLKQLDSLSAAERFKACFDIQEFLYGSKDPRTCKTKETLDMLKKDPTTARAFFSYKRDGVLQERPPFQSFHRISHAKDDLKLFQKVKHKSTTLKN